MIRRTLPLLLVALAALPVAAGDWSGDLSLEATRFVHDPLDPRQGSGGVSLSFSPEWYTDWNDGDDRLQFAGFLRWDAMDDERSHADLRELYWRRRLADGELRVGLRKVFWGVTESQHLVDVINQTDGLENLDGEDKLGQPMLNYAWFTELGTVDVFVMPLFREREFPGAAGRLRFAPRVEPRLARYESADEDRHVDYALRWQHSFDALDLGVAWFQGTARDPLFVPDIWPPPCLTCEVVLAPVYLQARQLSLDAQLTQDAWLWKLEWLTRDWTPGRYTALTAGFERTRYGVFGTDADLGLIVEYLFDDRPPAERTTPFQDDLFLGARLAMNDVQSSELLAGAIVDLEGGGAFLSVEASRRFGQSLKVSLEARAVVRTEPTDVLFLFRDDDYLRLVVGWYF